VIEIQRARRARRSCRPAGVVIAAAIAVLGLAAGCIITTGQFLVQFDLFDPLTVTSPTDIAIAPVDLNTISVYNEHKDHVHDIVDLSIVGEITNTGATGIEVEVWMTTQVSVHMSADAVRADPTAVQLWGPLPLAPGVTRRIGWDESAATFRGRAALLHEVRGDGLLTLYILGPPLVPDYSFQIDHGALVLVIDAGV
jgi:hypothetical protein